MTELAAYPLLSTLLALPLLGALLTAWARRAAWVQWIALGATGLTLLCSMLVVAAFDRGDTGFQLLDAAPWIAGVSVRYLVGVDGISLLFLPATSLLFCATVVASWRIRADAAPRGVYFALLLLFEAATLGVFCALDTILFFACWEFTLLPLYFLVSLWGVGAGRQAAAVHYFLVMLTAGVPLLFGLLALAFGHGDGATPVFDLPTLLATPLPERKQYLVFLLLLAGFGVKVPLVPVHTWLPSLAMAAPAAVTSLLVGLKIGAYGLIRVAILYGGVAALVHGNLRGVLAYSSLSHVGLVLLGLASFSVSALQGALLQLLNFSVAAGGGFLLLSFLQRRTASTDIARLGGVMHRMPLLAGFFLLFGLAGIGLPGTSGFPGELLIVVATLHSHTGAGLAALFGTVLAAASFLGPFRQAFLGPLRNPDVSAADDLLARELVCLSLPALLIVVLGVYPLPLLEFLRPTAEAWVAALAGL